MKNTANYGLSVDDTLISAPTRPDLRSFQDDERALALTATDAIQGEQKTVLLHAIYWKENTAMLFGARSKLEYEYAQNLQEKITLRDAEERWYLQQNERFPPST